MWEQVRAAPAAEEEASPSQRNDLYGHREKYVRRSDGKLELEFIPLTAEDLLDPEVDDKIYQTGPHADLFTDLYGLLGPRFEDDPEVLLALRMKMIWGIEGLPNPIPDFAVIHGFRNPEEVRIVFDVPSEGVRPSLIIEVFASHFEELRRNDYEKKVAIYERAGVPEYLILEPLLTEEDDILLTGYRLDSAGRYQRIEPDSQERLLLETTGLLFGKVEGILEVVDTRTGMPLPNFRGTRRKARRAIRRQAEALKAAEEARIAAEERAAQEAAARKAAEAELARLRAELERR